MKMQIRFNTIIIFTFFLFFLPIILGKKIDTLNSINDDLKTLKTINDSTFNDEITLTKDDKGKTIDFNITYNKSDLLITILGNSLAYFEATAYLYKNIKKEKQYQIKLNTTKYFYNGFAAFIRKGNLTDHQILSLELKLLQLEKELIYFTSRPINKTNQFVIGNNHTDVVLENELEEECFKLYIPKQDEDDTNINYLKEEIFSEGDTLAINFLTYTKNIKAIFKDEDSNTQNEFMIDKVSMTYFIKENQYSEICFKFIDENSKNGSVSFEILNLTNTFIFNNFSLISGFPSEYYLPKGYSISYKTDAYKFKNNINLMDIKFHMTQGKSKLFIDESTNYQKYIYNGGELNEDTIYEDINGYILVKKVQENQDLVAVVFCPDNNVMDCKYEISMKNEAEMTYLFKNKISYSYINSYNNDFKMENFQISLENDSSQEIYIYFNIFSGNANIKFLGLDNKDKKYDEVKYLGNQKIYKFNNNIDNLFIQITTENDAYFSIYYELKDAQNINDYYLEEGILLYGNLLNYSSNNYIISNNDEKNYPFIATLNTFGNDININNNQNKIIDNSDLNLIQLKIETKVNNGYLFNISIKNQSNFDENSENIYSIILSNTNTKIQMNNGYNYINQLNENNKEVNFIYFFTKGEDNNKLTINFRKFSKNDVNITINTKENGNNIYTVKRLSKVILLDENEIKNSCGHSNEKEWKNICKIIINIKSENNVYIQDDKSTYIDFSIQVTANDDNLNPVHLPNNIFTSNLLIKNFTQKYYVEVPKNGIGKIYVDFMEGGGYANAFLKKDADKVNSETPIPFDYFNKYFKITNNYTSNCQNTGVCKIFINLETNEYMYKYNIYSKLKANNKELKAFIAPEYEYIYGNLIREEIHNYKAHISKTTNHGIINFYCDNCQVTLNNEEPQEIYGYYQYILDSSNNLSDKIINFSIKINDTTLTEEQNYSFRIISSEFGLTIIPMTSIRNEFCKIGKGSPCYFIFPIEKYNTIEYLRIFIPEDERVNILYRTINYTDYYKYDEEQLISNIKKKNPDTIQKNYFERKINQDGENKVYLIKIESDYSAELTIISSHYNLMNYTKLNLQLNDYTLLKLDKKNKNILLNYNEGVYVIQANLIKGKGKINIPENSEKEYILDYKIQENINLLVNSEVRKTKEIEVAIYNDKQEFIIYIRRILTDNSNKLMPLYFQRNNYINYLDIESNEKIWPLNFYMKLNISSNDFNDNENLDLKNINLNYKISNINDYNEKDNKNQKYKMNIFLVSQLYINQKKIDPNKTEPEEFNCQTNYREDLTTGYSLIEATKIGKHINENSTYLYIKISPTTNFNNINSIMFSSFDLTSDYYFPLNEYLLMSISIIKNTTINLGRKLKSYMNSILDLVLNDKSLDFTINSKEAANYTQNDTEIRGSFYYGKLILNKTFLENENKNILSFFKKTNNIKEETKLQNLLIKNRISESNELHYFDLSDDEIQIDQQNFNISFKPIVKNEKYEIDGPLNIIYNIRIYNYSYETRNFSNSILNNENPMKLLKYNNTDLDSNNEIKLENLERGLYYLSILAEARKGNIYEYFIYKAKEIEIITENVTVEININTNKNYTKGKYARSFIFIGYVKENEKGDYIKLSVKHKNEDENNYIFASYENSLMEENDDDLYKNSDYKTIDRETSLIIPAQNKENSILYIRIPCNDVCDFELNYVLYKKESVGIDNDECFDIEIDKISHKQKFSYSNDNIAKSLFTITSYSVNDFQISDSKGLEIDKTYFNGYSFILDHTKGESNKNNDISFTVEGDLMVKICHRSLLINNINEETNNSKDILVGDKIYTRIENGKNECFQIHNKSDEDIQKYMLSFISQTKNINVDFYNSSGIIERLNIDEESDSIILDSSLNKLCISKKSDQNDNSDAGLFINLLSINNEGMIGKNMPMPLIRGVSTRQKLEKGQIIYYRINENLNKRYLINVHLQKITGNTKIYYTNCTNFPNCSLSLQSNSNEKKNIFNNNNINFNITLEYKKEEIYHKSEFPVIVVNCESVTEDFCIYYIEISTDVDSIMLNKNRKIYSSIERNIDEYKYKISLPKNEENNDINNKKKLFIQIYSYIGSTSFSVNNMEESAPNTKIENYYQFNNNTILFIYDLNNNVNEFNISVKGEENSYYNIFYYVIDQKETNIYLPTGEMHYNIITDPNYSYNYYFQDKKLKNISKYLININPINCEIKYSKEKQFQNEMKNNFIINSNESITINYENNIENKDKCEFIISAIELDDNEELKDLLVIDGVYQKYHLNQTNNIIKINYLIPIKDINNKDSKALSININKKTENNLILNYSNNINNYTNSKKIINNNEIIDIDLKDMMNKEVQNNSLEEFNNFIILKINIYSDKILESQDYIDFQIKINENNLPTYLSSEEIEYGIINKGNYIYYYFEYKEYEKIKIYFNCKGKASFKVEKDVDKYSKELRNPNDLYYNNRYNLKKADELDKSNTNYININSCSHEICQAFIYIFIKDENNERAIFSLYRYSEKNVMNIPLNQNFEGVLLNRIPNYFYTDINFNGNINIVLNCKYCKMCYDFNDIKDKTKYKNTFIPSDDKYLSIRSNNNKLYYYILTENQGYIDYFSIYIFNNELPKFIDQNNLEYCETPCKLLLPIYQFYNISNNNIILYVPDDENTIIYEKIVKMKEGNSNLKEFDPIKEYNNTSKNSFISNKLIINSEEFIKNKSNNSNNSEDLYMEIQINSKTNEKENKIISFIISQFYDSLNYELIPQYQNFLMINNKSKEEINILKNSINNNNYKVDINLIEGNGIIKNNKDGSQYSLNYENQEGISFILNSGENLNLSAKNLDENNFIFYMSSNIKKKAKEKDGKKEYSFDEILFGKTNYLNYYRDKDKNDILPINLRLNINNIQDLNINFHLLKLIKDDSSNEKNENGLDPILDEEFDFNITVKNKPDEENKPISAKYYGYLRRGYIHLNQSQLKEIKIIEIEINLKDNQSGKSIKHISLEVTAFGINSDLNRIVLPRNKYLEMNITNKKQEIKLTKPSEEYKNTYLQLSSKNNSNLNILNTNFIHYGNINGNNYYSIINDSQKEYNLIINSTSKVNTLFIKYITAKNNIPKFNLTSPNVTCVRVDNKTYIFNCTHLKITSENTHDINYTYTLLIRLYNSFNFEDNKKPDNILIDAKPLQSYKKELTEEELKNESINYTLNFSDLIQSKYYICILGEVNYGNNVEYFLYNIADFDKPKKLLAEKIDSTWYVIIFILIFMLLFVTYFLIKKILYMRNTKEDEESKKKKSLILLL